MRLLKRNHADNISFTKDLSDLEAAQRKYAILSHTWGLEEEEVTFDDIVNGTGTDKPGYSKIQFCLRQMRRDGLDYIWLDTCCIDKRNSAELSKSLISMYRWYSNAEKCYALLSDVPQLLREHGGELRTNLERDFRLCRWFKRGWTLQELIAPSVVEFFSWQGISLGTKTSLERQVSEITHIPVAALRGQALSDFTVHERLQWQEGRETREPEDVVYSLLGLLDISMPVLYGEGRLKARDRLQSEIQSAQKGIRHKDFSVNFSLPGVIKTPNFVAREQELQEMRSNLIGDGSRRYVVLHGLGGMGKTQLAIAYAVRHAHDYSAVFWLNVKDLDSIKLSFARIVKQILREHPSIPRLANSNLESNVDDVVDGVNDWLSMPMNSRWLTICDNYDNPKVPGNSDLAALDLCQFLPDAYQGSVIVTTRSSEVKLGHCMRMSKLENLQDGLRILEHSSGRKNLVDDRGAVQLAKKLDGLPLALATAGAYLSQSTFTFTEYLDFFERSWAKLQKRSPTLITYENRTLFSTWQISMEQIERRNSFSANLLRLWAYFDNQDLWFELLNHHTAEDPEWIRELVGDKLDFQDSIQVLCDHGLVEANAASGLETESQGYSVHACVHSWMLAVLNAKQDDGLAGAAIHCVASHVPMQDSSDWSLVQRRLLKHANRCSSFLDNIGDASGLDWACHMLGVLYADQGKMAEAEVMYMRALKGREKTLGVDHTTTLDTVNSLAILYVGQGRITEAEEMHRRVLRGRETALGLHHMSTLQTLNNLGILYSDQGEIAKAEEMYIQALRGKERVLGPGHTSTLNTVNNIGIVYANQGRTREAEAMYMRALRGRELAAGLDHTSTLQTVNNLGTLFANQGRMVEAEEMYNRALEGYTKALGLEHTSTLQTINNLGNLYTNQKKTLKAEEMYMQALQGYKKALGLDHTSTLDTINNLAILYTDQGRMVEAEKMYIHALKGYEKALGPDHTYTLNTAHNLGILYVYQGKITEAEDMYMHALRGREKVLGPDDISTLNTVNNLGILYAHQGKVVEAEEMYTRALKGRERALGPDHTSTLNTLYNISLLYIGQGRLEEAEGL